MASQKFDALFGGPAVDTHEPATEGKSAMDEMDQLMSGGLEPAKESNARKNSGAPNRADYRKQSNVSAGSGNAQLNALFGKDQTSAATNAASNKPRIRISKE